MRETVAETLDRIVQYQGDKCFKWPRPWASKRPNVNKHCHPAVHSGMSASRAIWTIANGEPPAGQQVLHTCGNGELGCVTLAHLYLGSPKQNVADKTNPAAGLVAWRAANPDAPKGGRGRKTPDHIKKERDRAAQARYRQKLRDSR